MSVALALLQSFGSSDGVELTSGERIDPETEHSVWKPTPTRGQLISVMLPSESSGERTVFSTLVGSQ